MQITQHYTLQCHKIVQKQNARTQIQMRVVSRLPVVVYFVVIAAQFCFHPPHRLLIINLQERMIKKDKNVAAMKKNLDVSICFCFGKNAPLIESIRIPIWTAANQRNEIENSAKEKTSAKESVEVLIFIKSVSGQQQRCCE